MAGFTGKKAKSRLTPSKAARIRANRQVRGRTTSSKRPTRRTRRTRR